MSMETGRGKLWLVPDYPPLDGEVGEAAVKGQRVYYPKVSRQENIPVAFNQAYSAINMFLFEKPKVVKDHTIYGLLRLGEAFTGADAASIYAANTIKNVDSRHVFRITPTGVWVPIVKDGAFCQETFEINDDENQRSLNDQKAKEGHEKRQQTIRQLTERKAELERGDIYDDQESLTFYTMKRVTEVRLREAIEHKKKELEGVYKNLEKTRIILKRLEHNYPDYHGQWIERYDEERAKSGISPYIPAEDEFDEYDAWELPREELEILLLEKEEKGKEKEEN